MCKDNLRIVELISEVFEKTVESYGKTLKNYYPSHKSNGFTERNLTFNFSHNYLMQCSLNKNESVIIWQEVPLGNREHFDTLIIDEENESIIIIEAKRLGTEAKQHSIQEDFDRIEKSFKLAKGVSERLAKKYSLYALLLVDIWMPKKRKGSANKKENLKYDFENYKTIQSYGRFADEKCLYRSNADFKETYHLGYKLIMLPV